MAPSLKVAVVLGDDVFGRLDEFLAAGHAMKNMETGEPLSTIRDRILSANAYIGAFPLAEALAAGADVVIAGPLHRYRAVARSHDSSLRLEAGRMGQTRGRNNCRAYCRMRRAVHRRKLPGGLAEHSRHGEHRLSDHRSRTRRALQHHQARRHRRARFRRTWSRSNCSMNWAIRRITSRPIASPISPRIQLKDAGPDRVQVSGIRGGRAPGDAEAFDRLFVRLEGDRHAGL